MPTLNASLAATVLERADRLAACTEEPGRLTRRFATPALARAQDLVLGWMRDVGMAVRRDAIGNVIGRREPPGGAAAGTLLLGSHLDTVRDAGRYDGMLGVLVALACAQRVRHDVPFAIEVLAFADEEGVRYGTAYLGSSVVAGACDPAGPAPRGAPPPRRRGVPGGRRGPRGRGRPTRPPPPPPRRGRPARLRRGPHRAG